MVPGIAPSEALPVPRAPVQWYGGKGNMVAKLLPLTPEGGRPYCEPYCGAASLFWNRKPAPVDVLNDLNGDLVNLFRCLQDWQTFDDLKHRLTWTLYSRAEFARAIDILNSGMAEPTNRWLMRLSLLDVWRLRIQRVQIDNRDALEMLRYWDAPDAVFYLDPPYVADTRAKGSRDNYRHEADDAHHAELVEVLLGLKGSAVLSGYDHPIYAPLAEAGWERIEFQTAAHAAGRVRGSGLQGKGAATAKVPRVEVVWRKGC